MNRGSDLYADRLDPLTPGLLGRLAEPPRKVALVRASRIGDFICATPAFRALRAALPGAEISLIGLPFVRELVERSPHLDRFIEFPGFPGMAAQFFDARKAARFFSRMQDERFDLVVQMHGSGVFSNPFALMLGARLTVGFIRAGDDPDLLDAACPFPTEGHQAARVLSLPLFLGAPPLGTEIEFPLWPGDHAEAARLLEGLPHPFIGLHPGARDLLKRWPTSSFAAAGLALRRSFGGTLVVVGSEDDRPLADEVANLAGPACLDLAGCTSLGSLGGVISRLALLITNDSGPAHIAYALGTPSVTIFSDTDPAEWGPDGGPHEVVTASATLDDGAPSTTAVSVSEVVAAAQRTLARATVQAPLGEHAGPPVPGP